MMIHDITVQVGKHKSRKRLGRGIGSGHGKTCGKGHKGQASRSGFSRKANFEGGQMPFFKRFEKRGFSNANFRKDFQVVNVKDLNTRFNDGEEVDAEVMFKAGLIQNTRVPVKVLAEGQISKKLKITANKFSAGAQEKITKAGGTANVIDDGPVRRPKGVRKDKNLKADSAAG